MDSLALLDIAYRNIVFLQITTGRLIVIVVIDSALVATADSSNLLSIDAMLLAWDHILGSGSATSCSIVGVMVTVARVMRLSICMIALSFSNYVGSWERLMMVVARHIGQ